MSAPDAIQAAALECVGTPWVYQGRVPYIGLDCVGLVDHCRRAAGFPPAEVPRYAWPPAPELLLRACVRYLKRVDRAPEPGDVLALWDGRPGKVRHCGVVVDGPQGLELVEAHPSRGEVTREALTTVHTDRLHSVWTIPSDVIADPN